MKITVINGNLRKGSTWHCMDLILQELAWHGETEVTEFFLPKDMPHFCNSCYSCFCKGENTCPHAAAITPIASAIEACDLVVLTSPVYALDVSGQLKALLDHLCFMWMSHRPNPKMFHKIGLTVSTTAGAGLGQTTKTMRNSLFFWGVKKTFSFRQAVAAMKWGDIPEKKQAKIQMDAKKLAAHITKATTNVQKLPNPPLRSILFNLMAGAQKKNDWNLTDRSHWEKNGWLSGGKPY